jgi:hypothetical protein
MLAQDVGVLAAQVVHGLDGAQESLSVRLEPPKEGLLRLWRRHTMAIAAPMA